MVPLEQAREFVLEQCAVLPPQTLALPNATGCVLANALVAGENVPPFENSAVDGYAVRADDLVQPSTELLVADEVAAGAASSHVLQHGEAIRIMTGAPMPAGADAVVMVEDTERLDDGARVRINALARPGQAVRAAGDDIREGTTAFAAGTAITPSVAGVLSSVNARHIAVVPRAVVAVLSTGDELIDDGSALGPGQIRESNKTMLLGLVAQTGAITMDLGVIRDDEAALETALRQAADTCDAIVSSGGVSMGDYDVVKAVLSRIATMRWMQIAIKPAKPFAFGLLTNSAGRQIPIFGLPGNPVSSLVSFELLARPALRKMMGHAEGMRQCVLAITDNEMRRSPDGKVHFLRVHGAFGDDGRYHVSSRGPQGSHQLAATALANTLLEVPDGPSVPPGSELRAYLLA